MRKAAYCLTLIMIAANLNAGVFSKKAAPKCGFKVVSYKFVGNAGTPVVYGKKTFTIPQTGTIELIAQKEHTSLEIAGRAIEIPNVPTDEFGTATVELTVLASRV